MSTAPAPTPKTIVDFAQALTNITGYDIRTLLGILEQLQAGTLPSFGNATGTSIDMRDCRILLDLLGTLSRAPIPERP
jgi:hypothetical protein